MKVEGTLVIHRIYINESHRSKTLHFLVEVSNHLVEGLVDIGASMSIMATRVVHELGIMHLFTSTKSYKTPSSVGTQALGRVNEIHVRVGEIQCFMTFMVLTLTTMTCF
jgi:predicted aspartyl protease